MLLKFGHPVSETGRRLRRRLSGLLDRQAVSESGIIMITALVVGIGAGLGAVAFRWLIATMQTLAYDKLGGLMQGAFHLDLLLIPALGGAIYGPLIYH